MPGRPAWSYRDDAAVPAFDDSHPVIVFDGDCVFCSRWVRFVLRLDRMARYRFVVAQSPLGEALYRHYGLDTRDYETNLLIEGGRVYVKSAGTIRMAAGLGFPWSLLRALRIVPLFALDALYEVVARNRYRIAGRRTSCFVPTVEQRGRFID